MSKEEKKNRLEIAKKHIFSTGIGDAGSALCKANMVYGIAKIHSAQEQLGMESNATFISGPDETVTRNENRWKDGFGYGGKITWGNGNIKMIVLDVMPNACGMLVGGLDELPIPQQLIHKIGEFLVNDKYIDDISIEWDFSKSNHFIDLYSIVKTSDIDLPKYGFIIHSGTPELKGENPKGTGFYYHKSERLRNSTKLFETPFGKLKVLLDDNAKTYLNHFKFGVEFSKKKREYVAKELFPNYKKISNTTHQGLINYNEIMLGTNSIKKNNLYPIALRADLPAYLLNGKDNLSEEIIEGLGFTKRAERLGVYERLKNANILPHGGGYAFKHLLNVDRVFEINNNRYFVIEMQNSVGQNIISDPRDIEFDYRGRDIVVRTLELNLGTTVARLVPEYVIKV